jgi:hypothetical protein
MRFWVSKLLEPEIVSQPVPMHIAQADCRAKENRRRRQPAAVLKWWQRARRCFTMLGYWADLIRNGQAK